MPGVICLDCGQPCPTAITPLCDACARIAVLILGTEQARINQLTAHATRAA